MEESCIVHLQVIDGLNLSLVEPLDALAVFPESKLNFIVFGNHICAKAVLLALVPIALIAALVSPGVNSEPMLFVIFVLPLVHATVVPDIDAHAFHVVVQPLSLVTSTVEPRVDADS